MKKIAIVLALTLALTGLVGCGNKNNSSTPATSGSTGSSAGSGSAESGSANLTGTLEEIMDQVLASVPEDELPAMLPADMNGGAKYMPLTAENSVYNVGVEATEYKEGIAADAAMSAVAHSVCLLRAESAEAAAQLVKDVEAKADARKWICVEAEKKIVDQIGDVVILIMSNAETADKLHAGFQALAQ